MRTWMTRSHTHSSTCPTPHHTKGRSNQPSAQAWIPQYIARPDTHNPFTFSNRMADLPAGCKVERGKEWRDVGPSMCPKWPPIPYVGCNLMRRRRLSDKSLPGEYRCLISTKPGSGATYWPWLWPTCLPEKWWMLLWLLSAPLWPWCYYTMELGWSRMTRGYTETVIDMKVNNVT